MSDRIVYLDGEYVPAGEARVGIDDQGFLHGYGLFETFRAYRGVPFALERHLVRLARGLEVLRIHADTDLKTWSGVFAELLRRCGLDGADAELRLRVSAGPKEGAPTILATADPLSGRTRRIEAHGVRAITLANPHPAHYLRAHKTSSYVESSLGLQEAKARGADEGLFVDAQGNYLEGCTTNLFAVEKGTLRTAAGGVLPGVTRAIVLELAAARRMPVVLWPLEPALVRSASELFVTNSIIGIAPIVDLDGVSRKKGPVTQKLADALAALIEQSREK